MKQIKEYSLLIVKIVMLPILLVGFVIGVIWYAVSIGVGGAWALYQSLS